MGYQSLCCILDNKEIEQSNGYRKIIDSWGFNENISDIKFNSDNNTLLFLYNGVPTSCPAETLEMHKERIGQAQKLRVQIYSDVERYLE